MATKFATAYVDVDANLAPMRKSMAGIGKIAGAAGAAIAGGLALELRSSIKAFTETEKVGRQTNAVLKSTGRAAGISALQVGALATAISKKSGMDDEAVQSAENLLLTFTNVRNEAGKGNKIFNRATGIIADMSVALGQDMKSSAIQVGKALNDPIKGVTALQRVGVSFTKSQKDQIKTLVDSGRTMDAQKLILRELNTEFAGSAQAQAQPLDKLKVSLGNIQEAIGSGFKPAVDDVAMSLTHLSDKVLPHVQGAADDVGRIFGSKKLDLGEKINKSISLAKLDLEPITREMTAQFKDQHFGKKIEDAVEFVAPKLVDGFAHSAPQAAGAFVNAFKNADVWGKLLTVAFIGKKLGFGSSAGLGALLTGRGSTPATPLFVADITGKPPGGGSWFGKAGKFLPGLLRGAGPTAAAIAAIVEIARHNHHNHPSRGGSGTDRRRIGGGSGVAPSGQHSPFVNPRDPSLDDYPDSHRRPRHHRRRRHQHAATNNGPAVAHLSSFAGPAVARMASAAFSTSSPTGGFLAPGGIASGAQHRIASKAARKFMDDLRIAPQFDDVFVNQTGLKSAVIASRFSKEKARHLRHRRRGHHPIGTGGIQAPVVNDHHQDNRSVVVNVAPVEGRVDANLISSKIARELDRLG